ncbi:MAG: hypothetical protein ACYC2T_13530 [Bacillota bacterium]
MLKFKDRVLLGAACALLTAPISLHINAAEYRHGLTDEQYSQTGASIILPHDYAKKNTKEGKLIGSLVNNVMISVSGVAIAYILSITGRDKAMIKGAGFSALEWITLWGLTGKIGLKVRSKKPLTHILSFVDHVIFGSVTALLVSKLGDNSLFPDNHVKPGHKLPLISNPNNNE